MSKTHAQLLRFLVVGITAVLIDWTVYRLVMAAGLTAAPAKAISFLAGTVFAFFANRQWTFAVDGKGSSREVGRFLAVYGGTLAVNVGVNSGLLALIGRGQTGLAIAFVIATGISATLNFLGMKFLVFQPVAP